MAGKGIVAVLARIGKLWRIHAYLDFMWMTRDTKLFLICYFGDAVSTLASITAMLLLAERFKGIGHWSMEQLLFMLGYGSFAAGLVYMFFGFNIFHISRRIGRGQLDHTLIAPQPVWLTLLTEGFTPFQSSSILLPGIALIIWSLHHLPVALSPGWLALFALNLLGSVLVAISLAFLWGSVAFWAPRAGEEINTSIESAMGQLKIFPLDGVGPVMLGCLTTVFPIGFLAWYPSRALLGMGHDRWHMFITPLVAVVCVSLAAWVFLRGLHHYANIGSSRYHDRGHRR